MSDHYRGYPWSRKGEPYDEMIGEGSLEEEELDPEEAERSITQFVRSADELSGPPLSRAGRGTGSALRLSPKRPPHTGRISENRPSTHASE
jgi:hypothetical protein